MIHPSYINGKTIHESLNKRRLCIKVFLSEFDIYNKSIDENKGELSSLDLYSKS